MSKFTVIANKLNLRENPGVTYDAIRQLDYGETVTYLGASADQQWFNVETEDDEKGWVNAKYLKQTLNDGGLIVAKEEFRWMAIALGELGVKEVPGAESNPRIVEYLSSTTLDQKWAASDETAWCSAFVNYCVEKSGYAGTDSAWARSWLKWGREIKTPRRGCVAILSRGENSGHVAFYLGAGAGNNIQLLGGNQGDKVGVGNYPQSRVLGYRIN